MLKHGLIADADYWTKFKELNGIDFADFDGLIYRSIEIKNEIVGNTAWKINHQSAFFRCN
jgi:3-dehydroquinate synthase